MHFRRHRRRPIKVYSLSEPAHGYFYTVWTRIAPRDGFGSAHLNDWAVRYVPYDPEFEGSDKVELLV